VTTAASSCIALHAASFGFSLLVIPAEAGIQLLGSVLTDSEKLDIGLRRYDGFVEVPRFGR
jgi:hypothetical protein